MLVVDEIRKPVEFLGSSLADLQTFPDEVRSEAGHQISRVQLGLDPVDWKPMPTVGGNAYEIRIRETTGAFRVIYVAKLKGAIFVLHCFQKKTQKTISTDIALAARRYKELPQ